MHVDVVAITSDFPIAPVFYCHFNLLSGRHVRRGNDEAFPDYSDFGVVPAPARFGGTSRGHPVCPLASGMADQEASEMLRRDILEWIGIAEEFETIYASLVYIVRLVQVASIG